MLLKAGIVDFVIVGVVEGDISKWQTLTRETKDS